MTNDRQGRGLVPHRESVTGGFSPSVEFISSVIAGLLIGLVLDWWLNTGPAFTIVFIIGGFVSGFYKLWNYSAILEEQAEERRRG
jgi:F0F1-type ATP synthase assembly protein I